MQKNQNSQKILKKKNNFGGYTFPNLWPKSNSLQWYSGSDKQIQEIKSDRVPEELLTEVCDIVQEAVIKTIPKKKKCKKAKWLSEKALQIAEKRREAKGKGEIPIWMQSSKE